jgi:hypothetical protein
MTGIGQNGILYFAFSSGMEATLRRRKSFAYIAPGVSLNQVVKLRRAVASHSATSGKKIPSVAKICYCCI